MERPAEQVPLVDLAAEHAAVGDEIAARWAAVVASSMFLAGDEIECFERDFARFCEVEECVTVASGSDALELTLRAAGVLPASEVIVPAATFVATALAVLRIGARPVLVDVDAASLIDPEQVRQALTPRTSAVVAVHLYGQMAPVEEVLDAVGGGGVSVIEDAAQAHGARRNGKGLGALSDAASTSFYPTKNLGAYGHGGAVLTNSSKLAWKVRALRSYGSDQKHHHPLVGWNSQLDELQAAVLNAKLPHLVERNRQRQAAAAYYDELLAERSDVTRLPVGEGNEHVWHLYVVRVPRRHRVVEQLRDLGVQASIHYPLPLHLHGAFRELGHKRGDFPVAEALADSIVSLPLFPTITPTQQQYVVRALNGCL